MSKRMTEAAKLYWNDIDVLEDARSELVDYFDSVWSLVEDGVDSLIKDNASQIKLKIDRYVDRKKPGKYYLSPRSSQTVNFDIIISDPRRSDDGRFYNLEIRCYQSHQKKIDALYTNARSSINKIAASHGVNIVWDNSRVIIHKSDIEVSPDDSNETADRINLNVEKITVFIIGVYSWMQEQEKIVSSEAVT